MLTVTSSFCISPEYWMVLKACSKVLRFVCGSNARWTPACGRSLLHTHYQGLMLTRYHQSDGQVPDGQCKLSLSRAPRHSCLPAQTLLSWRQSTRLQSQHCRGPQHPRRTLSMVRCGRLLSQDHLHTATPTEPFVVARMGTHASPPAVPTEV